LTLTLVWKEGNFFYAGEGDLVKFNSSNYIPYHI